MKSLLIFSDVLCTCRSTSMNNHSNCPGESLLLKIISKISRRYMFLSVTWSTWGVKCNYELIFFWLLILEERAGKSLVSGIDHPLWEVFTGRYEYWGLRQESRLGGRKRTLFEQRDPRGEQWTINLQKQCGSWTPHVVFLEWALEASKK